MEEMRPQLKGDAEVDGGDFADSGIEKAVKLSILLFADLEKSAPTTAKKEMMHIRYAEELSVREVKKRHESAMEGKKRNTKQSRGKGKAVETHTTSGAVDFTRCTNMSIHINDSSIEAYLAGDLTNVSAFSTVPPIQQHKRMNFRNSTRVAVQVDENYWALGWIWDNEGQKHVFFHRDIPISVFEVMLPFDQQAAVEADQTASSPVDEIPLAGTAVPSSFNPNPTPFNQEANVDVGQNISLPVDAPSFVEAVIPEVSLVEVVVTKSAVGESLSGGAPVAEESPSLKSLW
ncbi:hypothetical protein BKA61DRAFT_664250 [Leptodontidium sp. MPI-SDFR-AT-0119]|nr:hypothetical protein BKA61DRAFT_664250 [Leptodontidium sp. MPI-SDFR-AT-0119]